MKKPDERKWCSAQRTYVELRTSQQWAYRTGYAITSHVNAQHGGKLDPNCPACAELIVKCGKQAA